MDSVTQQNAALVEQVSAAAAVLERQTGGFATLRTSSSGFPLVSRNGVTAKAAPRRSEGMASAPAQSTDEWVSRFDVKQKARNAGLHLTSRYNLYIATRKVR